MISQTEENYLKTIFKITEREGKSASTNTVAAAMNTTAASVTDMFNRLKAKNLVNYEKAKGVTLTTEGGAFGNVTYPKTSDLGGFFM